MTNILPTTVDWQPIENAPKDGTVILAWNYCDDLFMARFEKRDWEPEGSYRPVHSCRCGETGICAPTFWAPMPELPKEDWQ